MDKPLILATLGPAGTHSESAARIYAKSIGDPTPALVFGQIVQCLTLIDRGQAGAAVLPAENLVDGLIGPTFDALFDCRPEVQIFAEVCLPIVHTLAARENLSTPDLVTIYSHPSALNQCARNLAGLVPSAQLIPVGSTAEAARLVAENSQLGSAAVCSEEAANRHNLRVICPDINDYPANRTRFLVCGHQRSLPTGVDRTWIAVHYGRNEPGQLYHTAGAFAGQDVDLTSVHSRPFRARPGSYVLIFELCGHQEDGPIRRALGMIGSDVEKTDGWFRVLGSHPKESTN